MKTNDVGVVVAFRAGRGAAPLPRRLYELAVRPDGDALDFSQWLILPHRNLGRQAPAKSLAIHHQHIGKWIEADEAHEEKFERFIDDTIAEGHCCCC